MSEAVYEVYHAVNIVPLPEKEIVVYGLFYIFINWHGYILRLVLRWRFLLKMENF